jgi:hypothetical protein
LPLSKLYLRETENNLVVHRQHRQAMQLNRFTK